MLAVVSVGGIRWLGEVDEYLRGQSVDVCGWGYGRDGGLGGELTCVVMMMEILLILLWGKGHGWETARSGTGLLSL